MHRLTQFLRSGNLIQDIVLNLESKSKRLSIRGKRLLLFLSRAGKNRSHKKGSFQERRCLLLHDKEELLFRKRLSLFQNIHYLSSDHTVDSGLFRKKKESGKNAFLYLLF